MFTFDTFSDRIAYVVHTSGLTKTAFAKRINVSQSLISMITSGAATPSDRTISDICREFHIDEVWLRTGEGAMFHQPSRKEEIAAYLSELLGGERTEAEEVLISTMSRMSSESWNVVIQLIDSLSTEWQEMKNRKKDKE